MNMGTQIINFLKTTLMAQSTYKQFCPVDMSVEILGECWTIFIIRELYLDSNRFGVLWKGLPKIYPTLLCHRLKEI